MKAIYCKLTCFAFCLMIMTCASDGRDLSQLEYTYTLATKHAAGSSYGKNLEKFMTTFVETKPTHHESISIELKGGDSIEFVRPQGENKTKIIVQEKAQGYTFEVDSLSNEEIQQIINLRFKNFESFLSNIEG